MARNIFTLLLVADPLSPPALQLVKSFYKMYSEYYPVRFGEGRGGGGNGVNDELGGGH